MKTLLALVPVVIGTLLPGCATARNPVVLARVGPARAQTQACSAAPVGWLSVYSAFDIGFHSSFPERQHHSDYKIFSEDGKLLQKVHNDSGTILEDPVKIDLAPGQYRVMAQCNGYGLVTLPVAIVKGQQTIVHLDGGYVSPKQDTENSNDAVRLPDGEIVGWRASN